MKFFYVSLIAFTICLSFQMELSAQKQIDKVQLAPFPRWEFGLNGGVVNYLGDLTVNFLPDINETNLAYGGFLRYNVRREWALRASYLYGKLSGDDANFNTNKQRGFRFSTPLNEASVVVEWDAHGSQRYGANGFENTLSTVFFGGPIVSVFNPLTNYNLINGVNPTVSYEKIDQDRETSKRNLVLGVVLGSQLRYDYNEKTVIGLELGIRPTLSDFIDGVSYSGKRAWSDWYAFAGLSVAVRLTTPVGDSDNDGLRDDKDQCPDNYGSIALKGCPDTDGDGIIDKLDNCIGEKGSTAFQGCPDTDGDGISDYDDACPEVAGSKATKGCPDIDRDGIIDRDDACPTAAGPPEFKGCPDTDGDGLIDPNDKCPTEKGPTERQGCPLRDTDYDGVPDEEDLCPSIAGPATTQGCPSLTKEDRDQLGEYGRAIEFAAGATELSPAAKSILDKAYEILVRYPLYSLSVQAHVDNQGNDAANLKLTEKRAEACRLYLVSKGFPEVRIFSVGYGETKPIATNNTPEGRRLNRRIDFVLTAE